MAQIIEGMDKQKGWWFTGNGSFVSNGYVVYVNGLDGNDPNPIATGQFKTSLMDSTNTSKKTAFSSFIGTLKAIADAAAASEEKYL